MTTPNEQDRRIAAWFQDVPARVPERTIEAAVAHARTHPRRRDHLAALRRDPMGSGAFGLGRMAQPLPLLAALGLLLVAAFAGAAVGGWFDREPAVVPPVVSPSSSVAPPSDTPTTEPSPSTDRVDLLEEVGDDAFVDITDQSFTLTGAVSGDPGDRVDAPEGQVRVENDPTDPATIVLSWASASCDTSHQLIIGADGRTMQLTRQPCEGDSLGGLGHVLRLTFDAPAPAGEFDVTLETTP